MADSSGIDQQRLAVGVALGTPLGVLIALLTDNWGLIGIGIALGVVYGVLPSAKDRD